MSLLDPTSETKRYNYYFQLNMNANARIEVHRQKKDHPTPQVCRLQLLFTVNTILIALS